jgi:nucleoside 2-deoxyribosyltransferase
MRVCTAPETLGFPLTEKKSIFLAGSIEQGRADLWQDYVISQLDHLRVAVFNPRRALWNASLEQSIHNAEFNAQVNWELDTIESADVVFFNFEPDTLSPISLAELGYVLGRNIHGKVQDVIVVCPKNFWRRGNVEIMCSRGGFTLHDNLSDGISTLVLSLESSGL